LGSSNTPVVGALELEEVDEVDELNATVEGVVESSLDIAVEEEDALDVTAEGALDVTAEGALDVTAEGALDVTAEGALDVMLDEALDVMVEEEEALDVTVRVEVTSSCQYQVSKCKREQSYCLTSISLLMAVRSREQPSF
jgi:hypothetical protein